MLEFYRPIVNCTWGILNDPFQLIKISRDRRISIYSPSECYYLQFIIDSVMSIYDIYMLKELLRDVIIGDVTVDKNGVHIIKKEFIYGNT